MGSKMGCRCDLKVGAPTFHYRSTSPRFRPCGLASGVASSWLSACGVRLMVLAVGVSGLTCWGEACRVESVDALHRCHVSE